MFKIFDTKHVFVKLLLFLCFLMIAFNIHLSYENDRLLAINNRNWKLFQFGYNKDFVDMLDFINLVADATQENDKGILELISMIEKNIAKIRIKQKKIERDLLTTKKVDIKNIDTIIGANLLIYNKKSGYYGSGTHIKINGENYVLTVNHLLREQGNELIAITDIGDKYPLHYVKSNTELDLGLFEIENVKDLPYLEISNANPKPGSEVLVIGNPSKWLDIITDGIIAKKSRTQYYLTNITYFGGSGGAVLYKDKVIGVVSQLYTDFEWCGRKKEGAFFISYTVATNLDALKLFLAGVK